MPDSVYAWFDIISNTCHPAPCYLNSDRVFLLMSNQYRNPEQGFKPVSSSECLLEFDTHTKPLGHHGRFYVNIIIIKSVQYSGDMKSRLFWNLNGQTEVGWQMLWIFNGI